MLVNLEPFGRLGNRLFLGAHLLAFGLKYNVPTLNLGFAEYAPLFPWMEGNQALAFPWRQTGDAQALRTLTLRHRVKELLPWSARFRYWGSEDFNFDTTQDPRLLTPLRAGRTVYLRTWLFRGPESLARYRATILDVFRPQKAVENEAAALLAQARDQADRVIGVHVRWEDYRGTEFFLDQATLRSRMETIRAFWPDQRVRFLLFSNEALPRDGWGALDVAYSPGLSVPFDLHALSLCDGLLGPPSTFSGWASFAGAVPLLTLSQHRPQPVPTDFQVVG